MVSFLTSEALEPFWLSEWYSQSHMPVIGVRKWIQQNKFQVNNPPISAGNFSLNFIVDDSPLSSIAFDCNRFASAAIETFSSAVLTEHPSLRNSIAWMGIKNYYAAFYAAHAFIRIFGRSCTQIDASETNIINDVASLFHSPTINIQGGYYNIRADFVNNSLNFMRSAGMRPHHLLWHEFTNLLEELIVGLQISSTRYQPVMLKLQTLLANLRFAGHPDGLWLSKIREDINYRHEYGSWFPYKGVRRTQVDKLVRLVTSSTEDSLEVQIESFQQDDTLMKFFSTTKYIVTLCCEILSHIDNVNRHAFPKHQPIKLLRLMGT